MSLKKYQEMLIWPPKNLNRMGNTKNEDIWSANKTSFWNPYSRMEQLEEGFYHKNTNYIGKLVIWNTQQIRTRGIQLTARGANNVWYCRSINTLGITTKNHLIKPTPKSITESTQRANKTKSRQELEQETGKALRITATQIMLTVHETLLKDMENPGIGPQHEQLTRMLNWGEKAENTSTSG